MAQETPLASDTSLAAERRQFEAWGKMTPAEKFAAFLNLMRLAETMAEAGIRRLHPAADEHEVFLRLAARRLDAETMRKVYSVDVAAFA